METNGVKGLLINFASMEEGRRQWIGRQERKCTYWPASAYSYWSVAVAVECLRVSTGGTSETCPKMYFCLRLARFLLISAVFCVGKRHKFGNVISFIVLFELFLGYRIWGVDRRIVSQVSAPKMRRGWCEICSEGTTNSLDLCKTWRRRCTWISALLSCNWSTWWESLILEYSKDKIYCKWRCLWQAVWVSV